MIETACSSHTTQHAEHLTSRLPSLTTHSAAATSSHGQDAVLRYVVSCCLVLSLSILASIPPGSSDHDDVRLLSLALCPPAKTLPGYVVVPFYYINKLLPCLFSGTARAVSLSLMTDLPSPLPPSSHAQKM